MIFTDPSILCVFTCFGVEWLAASGKDSASVGWASPSSVVMVSHLPYVNNMVTIEFCGVKARENTV